MYHKLILAAALALGWASFLGSICTAKIDVRNSYFVLQPTRTRERPIYRVSLSYMPCQIFPPPSISYLFFVLGQDAQCMENITTAPNLLYP